MKKFLIILIIIILIALGAYALMSNGDTQTNGDGPTATTTDEDEGATGTSTDRDESDQTGGVQPTEVIGESVNGREITAYHYGTGETELLIVGGIHGGYSPNTTLVSREIMERIENDPSIVPSNVTVTVIPALNPDGLSAVVGSAGEFNAADIPETQSERVAGRFNGRDIDLNRNFDCNWQSTGQWRSQEVDGGEAPFSEPESRALRDYVESNEIAAAVVYYSAAGGVYTSSCNSGVLGETAELMNTYADASGYPAEGSFDAYEVTGDATDWMAKQGVPAISVIMETHTDTEWSKNRNGFEALLERFGEQS